MNTAQELELLKARLSRAEIVGVQMHDDELAVELADGRLVTAPLLWFPRLSYGTVTECNNFIVHRTSIY